MKTNRGSNRQPGAPALPGAGRPKAYATVRLPIDDARAVLPWLEEARRMCINPETERGLSFLIAGLWSELTAGNSGSTPQKEGTTMITAQDLYDRREEYGEISGNDLHDLFQALTGDPSPTGRTSIDASRLDAYAAGCRAGQNAEHIARFCEAFTR